MLQTENFAYVHLERTGGNFLKLFFERFFAVHHVGYHYPRVLLPAESRHLPLLGFVRNPWDWYVSFFHVGKERPERSAVNLVASRLGKDDFRTTVARLVRLGSSEEATSELRSRMVELLPDSIEGNVDMGVTKSCLAGFQDENVGFYSWLVRRMFADEGGRLDGMVFGRFESLRVDLLKFLESSGVDVTWEMREFLDKTSPHGSSNHQRYSVYYDDDLRELVAKQERFVIDRFGYSF